MRKGIEIDGILVLDKPSGITSQQAVSIVKNILGAQKAGHLGTLDPIGTGVLPIALGKCTKFFDAFLKKKKEYISVFEFGKETNTLDIEGEVVAEKDCDVQLETINQVVSKFIGSYAQMPPQFSAKKVNGKKAYELARQGINVELKPKEISIYNLNVLKKVEKNTYEFIIECSSGTYIRSLCRDIAYAMSTYGIMKSIIRTRCGCFELKNAYTLEDIRNGKYNIISTEEVKKIVSEL